MCTPLVVKVDKQATAVHKDPESSPSLKQKRLLALPLSECQKYKRPARTFQEIFSLYAGDMASPSPLKPFSAEIKNFIQAHLQSDVAALALKPLPDKNWPRAEILNQIKARQKAMKKLPELASHAALIFPVPEVVEQASSAITASYKAGLAGTGGRFIDLTAGLGADALALFEHFDEGVLIEADAHTAACLAHNIPHLSGKPHQVHHARCEDILSDLPESDMVMIDPQRRETGGRIGLFRLEDTSPDIMQLLPQLRETAKKILLKTSPMLDIREGITALPGCTEVHVVEVDGNCKELLFLIGDAGTAAARPALHAAALGKHPYHISYPFGHDPAAEESEPLTYLYEPGPALMKSGLHTAYAAKHGLSKLHPQTHLYTSTTPITDYPGRSFKVLETLPIDKKAVQGTLPERAAGITCRNVPITPEALRKKLQLKESNQLTLFAATLMDETHKLILCQKDA